MKERILETTDRLFYGQGIRAVGVDTVAAEIGISKRTLYNHFPSKDALIAAYLAGRFNKAPASDKPPVKSVLSRWTEYVCFVRVVVRNEKNRTAQVTMTPISHINTG